MPRTQKNGVATATRPRVRRTKPEVDDTRIVKADIVTPTVLTPVKRERELTQPEIDLVHRTVAKGTSPDQFALFLWHCRKHRVDPVAREIYCVLFNNRKHHQDFDCPGAPTCTKPRTETGIWHDGKDMSIMMGIGGLRGLAARNHPNEYGSTDEPVFVLGPEKTKFGKTIPVSCTVSVWKKGAPRPTSATLFWEEFAPNLEDSRAEFWNKMPKNQLAKCAEAQALKKAYPDMADIYIEEEMARRTMEFTEGGRQVIPHEIATSHRPQLQEGNLDAAVEEFNRVSETSTNPVELMRRCRFSETVAKRIAKENAAKLADSEADRIAKQEREAIQEEPPIDVTPSSPGPAKKEPEPTTRPAEKAGASSAEPQIVKGTIERSIAGMAGKIPVRDVTLLCENKKKPTFRCFDQKLFTFLDKGQGKVAEVFVKQNGKFWNLIGLWKIGATEFAEGHLPIIQRDREVGTPELFK